VTIFPAGISAQGQGALWYVPAIAGANGPTAAEVTAGIDISCMINGFAPSAEQAVIQKTRYCTTVQYEIPGRASVTIAEIEAVYNPQLPTDTATYKSYSTMKENVAGFLLNRLGLAFDATMTTGQFVDVYPIICGIQARVGIDPTSEGDEIRYRQKLFVSGPVRYDKALLA
jgi:hypothetical protein